jgi:AmmeMemoRadiSam system protein B
MAGKLIAIALIALALTAGGATVRPIRDRVGFATSAADFGELLRLLAPENDIAGKSPLLVISPHDDFLYAARQYNRAFAGIAPRTFIILGVFHSGGKRPVREKLLFDSFESWETATGSVPVSGLREKLLGVLDQELFEIDDQSHLAEHSLEAEAIFLHSLYPDARILPVIVAPSGLDFLKKAAKALAASLESIAGDEPFVIVSSADAVHYGNENWGDSDFLYFGPGEEGYQKANQNEKRLCEIISQTTAESAEEFFNETTNPDLSYRLSWCGRFTITLGKLIALELARLRGRKLSCSGWHYENSLEPGKLAEKLGLMGLTAPATIGHWVGYPVFRFIAE